MGVPRQNVTNIRVNYRRGIDKVIDYLHSLGHRNLGFVGHHSLLGPINERAKAFLRSHQPIISVPTCTACW